MSEAPYKRTWHGYPSWLEYLKANVALTPILVFCGGIILMAGDSRYMVREKDGETIETQIKTVQTAVTDIQVKQEVFKSEMEHVKDNIQDVKRGTDQINAKLDRLIERESDR